MFKSCAQPLLIASLLVASTATFAEESAEPTPAISISGSMTMATDYRFRGISNTDRDPAIQGLLTFAHKSGAYVSLWASNSDLGIESSIEADLFVGYILPLTEKSFLDLNYVSVNYPGAIDELHADFGEFGVNYNHSDLVTAGDYFTAGVFYSPEYTFKSGNEFYLNSTYKLPVYKNIKLVSSVGYTIMEDNDKFAMAYGGDGHQDGYFDYKIGLGAEFLGLNSELVWIDNNIDNDAKVMKGSAVFSVTKSF